MEEEEGELGLPEIPPNALISQREKDTKAALYQGLGPRRSGRAVIPMALQVPAHGR